MTSDILNSIWPEWHVFSDPIGHGTYGFVYEAVRNDHSVTSRAAIKVISIPPNPGEIDSLRSDGYSENATRTYLQNIVNDFVKEIQLMESFKGVQNIVSVEDYKVVEKENEIGWNIYIRMELLTPLNTYTCDKTLSEEEVMKLGQDICTALALCAKRNVIHRDIKPENIFINEFGDFKLGDFGIARSLENFTGSLSRKGTPNYIAPEIEKGLSYDATADLYSLGLVLYKFMNKNRLPFLDVERQLPNPNENVAAIRRRINGEPLPPPCNASKEFSDIILRACAYDPHQRFASAEDMREEIALCLINNVYKKSTDNIDQTISARQLPQEQFKRRPLNTEKIPLSDRVIGKFGVQKKNKKLFLIGVGVSAAILLFCGLFSLAKIFDNNKELSTSGNNISTSDNYVKTVEEKNDTAAKTDSFVTDDIHTINEETTIAAAEEQHTTTEVKNTTTTENVNIAENIITTANIAASTSEKITYLMDACNSFDLDYATEYSEKANINGESFCMAGAEYCNGVVLNNDRGTTQTVSITYNVLGNYSTVSFYLGHLDETEMNPIELNIFLDNIFYKKISLEANDIPKYVEVDVSNRSTLRFTADLGYRTGYCLANLAVDVSSEDIAPVPNILESNSKYAVDRLYSYDYSYAVEYSEKLNTNGESFCMAGAEYRNGVVLNNNRGSTQTVSITYNVLGDYSTVSFYLGHLDETEMNPIELNIFLDNVFYKKINLEANDIPKYVEVDISNRSTLRFTADLGYRTGYCLANLAVDVSSEDIAPVPNIFESNSKYAVDRLYSYDCSYAAEYSEKLNTNGESFCMAGAEYRNGVVLNNDRGSTQTVSITYNVLGDYSTVSFYLGHLDETEMNPIELNIFLDNVFYKKINLEANDIPKYVEVDVSNKSTLRFTADLGYRTGYCLANLAVDVSSEDIAPIPNILESDSKYAVDRLYSYDYSYATEYSEKLNTNGESFCMAGAEYRNGVALNNNRGSTQTVSITYNVLGDYSTVSFYLGHLDETEMNPIELNIFLDNVFYKKINLEANDIPKYVEVDVSNKSTLRFTANLGYRTGYCLAEMTIT